MKKELKGIAIMGNNQRIGQWLSAPVDGNVLGLFRWVFGLFMAYEAFVYYSMGLIEQGFLAPQILFKFDGFGWVHPLPAPAMYAVLAAMGLFALLVAAGVWFRWACWGLALTYTYIFLLEKVTTTTTFTCSSWWLFC
ncbi:MAG: HTTM domain-containing protein [Lewinellaceae bacterium]|nr:HTTM domain-containing protein [Lewinellaceae bacterium]